MGKTNKYPPIVYKYRNWIDEHHKNVLLKNQVYFTSPKDFNDPFDCRIPQDFSLLNTNEKIKTFIQKIILDVQKALGNPTDLTREAAIYEHRIITERDKIQKEYEAEFFNDIDNHHGVLALSSRWNSILMWSHYADQHKGYCVGFWEEKFRQTNLFSGGAIHYPSQNEFPQIDPLDEHLIETLIKETHYKSNEWKYEEEFRLVKIFYPNVATDFDRIFSISDDFIAEIIIGLSVTDKTREDLIQIARNKKIKIFQAIKVPFKFEIDRKEIM